MHFTTIYNASVEIISHQCMAACGSGCYGSCCHRHAVMGEELCCYQWPEEKYLRELILVSLSM